MCLCVYLCAFMYMLTFVKYVSVYPYACVCVLIILCSHVDMFMVYMYVPAFAWHIVMFNKYLKNTYTALQQNVYFFFAQPVT